MPRRLHTPVLALLGAVLLAGLLGAGAARAATGDELQLEVDQGQVVRLPSPASSIFVANPAIADVQVMSPTLVYIYGRQTGTTRLLAIDEREELLVDRRVAVSHDLTSLTQALGELLPGREIGVRSVRGGILLTGGVADATEAADATRLATRFIGENGDVINRLAVAAPQQVMLKVRVAEVSRSVTKHLGFNWEGAFQIGTAVYGFGIGDDIVSDGAGGILRPDNNQALFGSFTNEYLSFTSLIDALADDGLVTLLAEPNLTAMSGETATFLAGGEFPIVVPDDDAYSIDYQEFGVSLSFNPTVLSGNRINLRVRPEVSELSSAGAIRQGGFEIPAILTRRAETTVELGSGQSFAIAGLLQNATNQGVSKYPFLGDIPVLGALFRSTSFQNDESELVIIVTPYLVEPVSADRLATPVDGFTPPNDEERILRGDLWGQDRPEGAPAEMARNALVAPGTPGEAPGGPVGPTGFIVE
jgi:pilus assembly protein CpaC